MSPSTAEQRPYTTMGISSGFASGSHAGSSSLSPSKRPQLRKVCSMPALGPNRASTSHSMSRSLSMTSRSNGTSTPGSMCLSPIREGKRPGTGRFYSDELMCFKRVPTPSPGFNLADWGLTGDLLSDGGLPRLVSTDYASTCQESYRSVQSDDDVEDTFSQMSKADRWLPLELPTARVLERILPQCTKQLWRDSGSSSASSPKALRQYTEDCSWNATGRTNRGHKRFAAMPAGQVSSIAEDAPVSFSRLPTSFASRATSSDTDIEKPRRSMAGMCEKSQMKLQKEPSKSDVRTAAAVGKLQRFRQKMIEKFATVKGAFEAFADKEDGGLEKELSKSQFSRFLNAHFNGLSKDDQEQIFNFLDGNKNGAISISEIHTAIESAAPVKTVDDLRRKWLALGYPAMRYPLQTMGWLPENRPDAGISQHQTKRISYDEFCTGMRRTGIEDPEEHLALYQSVQDTGGRSGTITVDQLVAAVAGVSPPMLLEEMRDKLLKKYGTLENAYDNGISSEGASGLLKRKQFCTWTEGNLGFSAHDAHRAFSIIDIDLSGSISRTELVSALSLVEPCLFLEEVRRKVRQRYKSIDSALKSSVLAANLKRTDQAATQIVMEGKAKNVTKQDLSQKRQSVIVQAIAADADYSSSVEADYLDILKKVQFDDSDIRHLISRIDVNGEKRLSPLEITNGLSIFAPSCLLQDLRLHVLSKSSSILEAFNNLQCHNYGDFVEFDKGLETIFAEMELPETIPARAVFLLIESRRKGGIFLDELVSALRCTNSGGNTPLSAEQRDAKARQQVNWQMSAFRKTASELRGTLRIGSEQTCLLDQTAGVAVEILEEEQVKETVLYGPVRESYLHVKSNTEKIVNTKVNEGVSGYYTGASVRMSDDMPLLSSSQNVSSSHSHANRHRRCLGKDAPLLST